MGQTFTRLSTAQLHLYNALYQLLFATYFNQ